MRWTIIAVAILIATACSPDDVIETVSEPLATVEPTTVPTTAAAVLPLTTPTAVSVPTREAVPTALPATVVPTPEPTATAAAEPAAPVAPGPTAVPPPPTPNESIEILASNGGEVYTLTCARCHAENGTGSDRYRGLIGVGNKYTNNAMIAELTSGHRVTFGFADKLSADEIASVVAYVKATFP